MDCIGVTKHGISFEDLRVKLSPIILKTFTCVHKGTVCQTVLEKNFITVTSQVYFIHFLKLCDWKVRKKNSCVNIFSVTYLHSVSGARFVAVFCSNHCFLLLFRFH